MMAILRRPSPLMRRRLAGFRANKRGYWSFWAFMALFAITLPAELIANDKPLFVWFDGAPYVPVLEIGRASCRERV